jgi:hypothetical protein
MFPVGMKRRPRGSHFSRKSVPSEPATFYARCIYLINTVTWSVTQNWYEAGLHGTISLNYQYMNGQPQSKLKQESLRMHPMPMLFHPLKAGSQITRDPDNCIPVIVTRCFLCMKARYYVQEKIPLGRITGADGKHISLPWVELTSSSSLRLFFFENLCILRIG